MFKLVIPAALVLAVVYLGAGLWRAWLLRNAPRPRAWAVFGRGRVRGRWLARQVRRADPTAVVTLYRLPGDAALARQLGVSTVPAVVLGDGSGGAKLLLEGTEVQDWLRRRRHA